MEIFKGFAELRSSALSRLVAKRWVEKLLRQGKLTVNPSYLSREKVMCDSTLFTSIIIFSLNVRKVLIMDFSFV